MERHLMVVMTNPVEGREAEYNDWYESRHLPDVLQIPGIVSAERFELSGEQRYDPPYPFSYLALYWIETNDWRRSLWSCRAGRERLRCR